MVVSSRDQVDMTPGSKGNKKRPYATMTPEMSVGTAGSEMLPQIGTPVMSVGVDKRIEEEEVEEFYD